MGFFFWGGGGGGAGVFVFLTPHTQGLKLHSLRSQAFVVNCFLWIFIVKNTAPFLPYLM